MAIDGTDVRGPGRLLQTGGAEAAGLVADPLPLLSTFRGPQTQREAGTYILSQAH